MTTSNGLELQNSQLLFLVSLHIYLTDKKQEAACSDSWYIKGESEFKIHKANLPASHH